MKKIYASVTTSHLNCSRFLYSPSLVKEVSLVAMIAFLSNFSPANAGVNGDTGDVQPKNVKENEQVQSVGVFAPVPVDEQAAAFAPVSAGVMSVDVTASAEGLQANGISGQAHSFESFTPSIEQAALSGPLHTGITVRNGQPNSITADEQAQAFEIFAPIPLDEQATASDNHLTRFLPINAVQRDTRADQGVMLGNTARATHYSSIAIGRDDPGCKNESGTLGCKGAQAVADRAIAIGLAAEVNNFQGIAIGISAKTFADNAITIGPFAKATAAYNIVIGAKANSTGNTGIALGYQAQTLGPDNIAIGYMAHASGKSAIAIGSEYHEDKGDDYTTAKDDYTTAVGAISKALDYGSTALGHRAYAYENKSISIGFYSRARNNGSIALGSEAEAKVDEGVAIGKGSMATISAGVAGYSPLLKGSATDTGYSWKSTQGVVSVGDPSKSKTRQITGVAAGSGDTDAANVAQVKSLQKYVDKGWKLSVGGANATAVSIDNTVDLAAGSGNLTITKGNQDNKVKFDLAKDVTLNSAKIGGNTLDATGLVITSGPKITTAGIDAGNKEIKNIKAGELSASSQQAVTGSQLYETNNTVTQNTNKITEANTKITQNTADITTAKSNISSLDKNISTYLGGGADVLQGKKPTYTVEGKMYNNVGSAFEGVNSSFTNVNNEITQVKENLLVKQEEEMTLARSADNGAGVITIGKETGGTEISILNKEKFTRTISGLSGGSLTENSTEAVNGSQIYILGNKIATYLGGGADFGYGNWNNPTFKIKTIKNDGSEGEESYMNIADAFAGVGSSFTNIKNEINKEINNVVSDSLVKRVEETNVITIGKEIGGTEIALANNEGKDRTLSGVKAAQVGNEAVNKAQLDENVKNLSESIGNTKASAVHYDKQAGQVDYTSVTLGGKSKEAVALHNVKAGDISEQSHDAVNGSQINTISLDVAKFLGGGAAFKNGAFTGPTYTLSKISKDGAAEETSYDNVGSAFAGLDTSISNVNTHLMNVVNKFDEQIKNITQAVQGDALLWSDTEKAFVATHGEDKGSSKIKFLANGDISKSSTDAITGSQLYSLGSSVAKSLGGSASYENGTWTAPTFTVKSIKEDGKTEDKEYHDVAEALADVGTSFTNIKNDITNVVSDSLVKQDKEVDAITIGKETNGTEISILNKEKASRKLSGVKAGTLSATSTDAVNGAQLYATNENVSTVTNDLKKVAGNTSQYLGGSADVLQGKKPTYTVQGTNYNDVGSAFAGVNTSITNVKNDVTNVKNELTKEITNQINSVKGDSLVKRVEETNVITIGKEIGGTEIALANSEGKDRTLSGVKAAKNDNDAVNKGQLDKSLQDLSNSLQSDESAVVHYDKQKDGKINYASVTLGGKDKHLVGLHNVANGNISKDSHDAINGSQINTISQNVAKFLGSNASFENGTFKGPIYNLSSITTDGMSTPIAFNDVGSAFAGLDTNIKNVNERIKEVSQGVAQDSLLWNNAEGAFVATHGEDKGSSKIKFLANGAINDSSTDAVAGNQLHKLGTQVATYFGGGAKYESGTWTAPTFKVKTVKADGAEIEEKNYNDVASAFEGVGASFTNITNEIKKEITTVQGDALLWSNAEKAFVAQHREDKGSSKIKFLANGDITATSTDAVNGSQLYSLGSSVAKSLGGSASYENGTWTAPTFTVKSIKEDGKTEDKEYHDVAAAFEGVGTSFTNLHNEVKNEINKVVGNSLVKQDKEVDAITIGKETNGTVINVANKSGVNRVISGVEDAQNKNDAVNKGQLEKGLKDLSNSLQSDESAVVHYDNQDGHIDYTSVTLGGKSKEQVALHNVKAGDISKDSHDAITGSQINTISGDVARFLGGNASFENGIFKRPTYKLSHVDADGMSTPIAFTDVGSAFAGLDTNIKNVNQRIKEVSQGVAQDSLLWNNAEGAFVATHGEDKGSSKIKFLANGDISKSSTDAITGSQLYTLGSEVAKYFGGGAKYENGQWSAPSFKLKTINSDGKDEEQSYETVASAFEGVGSSFMNVKNEITNQINNAITKVEGDNLVQKEKETDRITIGKETNGTEISILNKDSASRKLSGVKTGTLSATSTDAVNGAQLYATNENVSTVTNDLKKVAGNTSQYLGGSADVFQGKKPTYTVQGTSYNDVGSAFAGVDTSITNVKNDVTNVKNELTNEITNQINSVKGESLVKRVEETNAITIGKEIAGTEIILANNEGKARTLSGVKTAVKDNEAVNKAQLDENVKNLSESIGNTKASAVHYDKQKDDKIDYTSVTLGGKDKDPVGLHNVANGKISDGSHDAINGGQINTISQNVAKFLGGDTSFKDGTFTGPTYKLSKVSKEGKVEEGIFTDVGSAFAGLDTNFKNVNTHLTNVVNKFDEQIKNITQEVQGDALLWDKTKGAFVATHGEVGNKTSSKITSLQAGKIASDSTDAVNGGQLYTLGSEVAKYFGGGAKYEEGKWTAPSFTVKTVKDDGVTVEEKKYDNVAEALADVGTSFTNIKNDITNVVSDSLVKWDEVTKVIKIGGEKEGSVINIANKDKMDRTLSGVKAAENDNEAVNKSQLDKSLKKLSDTLQSEDSSVVLYDKDTAGKTDYSSVTFGKGKDSAPVALHNVADGKISDGSHDAINGSQINTISQNVAKFLGGDTSFKDGTFTGPTYQVSSVAEDGNVTERSYSDVGSAFAGLDKNFKNVNTHLTNVVNKFDEQIKNITQEVQSDALLWSDTEKAFIATHGENKSNSKITSLQAGKIASDSTDAVNGSQLHSLGGNVATYFGGGAKYENGQWVSPTFKVKTVNSDGSEGEEQTYQNVADAFAGVSSSITNVKNEITNVVSDSLVKWDEATKFIKIGAEKDGDKITLANNEGKDRTLSGVKAAENDNEAVNKGQLEKGLKDLSNSLQSDESAVVHYDKKGDDDNTINYASVTFGKGKDSAPVALHNVADGTIGEGSHDAITGGQINTISGDVAKFLGGDTSFKDGSFTGPTYQISHVAEDGAVTSNSYSDVGSAFAGLDTNFKNVNTHLTNVVNKFDEQIKNITQEVQGDALLWDKDKGAFVAQHGEEGSKTNSKITSLQNGDISESSTDAVNGSQLYSLNTTLAAYLGGNAKYENGTWIAPTFTVKSVKEDGNAVEEQSYETVAAAFEGVGTSFTNLHNEVKNEINKVVGDSLVKQDDTTKVIKIGGETEGAGISIANRDGGARSISGVKAATLSEGSTEAVNGGQLYSLNKTLATYFGGGAGYEDGAWTAPTFKVTHFKEDGSSEEKSYANVSDAFAGVSSSFTKLHNEISDNLEQNALLWSDEDKAFVALHGKGDERSKSKLKFLLDGDISEGSTEAITGHQLYSMSNVLAGYLGGGAGYKDGAWSAPSFKVLQFNADGSSSSKKSYPDVASAFDGVSESMTSINERIKEVSDNIDTNSLHWNEDTGSYDARHKGEASKITNVLAGKIAEGSQEVVNGGQLWQTNEKLQEVEHRVDTIDQQVQDITIAVTDGAVNYDKDVDGKKTNSITLKGGNESEPVLIDNLADGRIEEGSKQAVNGGQLHDYTDQQMKIVLDDAKKYTDDQVSGLVHNGVNEAKAYTDMKFETLNYAIEDVRKEARQAAAIGLAVAGLRYNDTPGKLSVSFGTGVWRSQSAFAFGAGYTSENGFIRSNLSVTSARGHWGLSAGINLTLN